MLTVKIILVSIAVWYGVMATGLITSSNHMVNVKGQHDYQVQTIIEEAK